VDLYEVSKKKWDSVYAWAITNGYHFSNPGKAKGPAHPVVEISWLDCAKWCNARSEREGLSPCFYLGGNVFKTSDTVPDCKFDASGYRLPTLNEWRYAARGSLADKRFPWGNTIQHSQANYMSGTNAYEVSPAKGGHPDFAKEAQPYTCPVDTFEPNGYGLYNMAGNVTERCWDISGSNRSLLGGSWSSDERALCIGFSSVTKPYHASDMDGFRTVRRTEQKENR
jgi:formylglycine-generating enzyme required for sulfatase activity